MTRLHFSHDDAQVCSEIVEKFWADICICRWRHEEKITQLFPLSGKSKSSTSGSPYRLARGTGSRPAHSPLRREAAKMGRVSPAQWSVRKRLSAAPTRNWQFLMPCLRRSMPCLWTPPNTGYTILSGLPEMGAGSRRHKFTSRGIFALRRRPSTPEALKLCMSVFHCAFTLFRCKMIPSAEPERPPDTRSLRTMCLPV